MQNLAGRAPNSDASAGRFRIPREALLGALFLGAWAATSFLAGKMLPFPNVPDVGQKYHYFAAHEDEFDTIFVGSSRMQFEIMPKEFDADTAKAGAGTHSFNLAFAGMWPPESFYFLRRILRLRPPHLKWVMIDLMDVDGRVDYDTRRAVYWHDGMHTMMAVRDVIESPLTLPKKTARIWQHAGLFLEHWANPGSAGELLDARMIPPRPASPPSWEDTGGFERLVERKLTGVRGKKFLDAVSAFKAGSPRKPARAVFAEACNEIAEEVRRAGAEPVFILAPMAGMEETRLDVPEGIALLDFNDPAQYPVLFDADLRYDESHLNEGGAIAYTHLLAQRFLALRRERAGMKSGAGN